MQDINNKMEKIYFSLHKKVFQKARFRKYLREIRENNKLIRGFLIIILSASFIFFLDYLFTHNVIHFIAILVQIFLMLLLIAVIIGNYSTWKDGAKNHEKTFNGTENLFFAYDDIHFVYGSIETNKTYSWQHIMSSFFIQNINYVILENKKKGQFHIILNPQQMDKLKETLIAKKISIHFI